MRTAQTVLTVIQERGKQHKPIERVYKLLFNRDFYLNAYAKLYPNNGAMTKGVTDETVDGMSIQKIDRMIELLREEKYQWKPARREYIPKKNGKKRPLGIPTWGDKLLQEVMREILEAYYEPQFSNHSHGFRPNRGCHTALQEIQIWKGTRWFIEGDISKYFDTIDHDVLLKILEKNIHDGRFLRLISNMLKAGYLDDWKFNQTISGTPQGGVISPLLANIYLNEFDQWIENTLIPQYTKGKRQKSNPVYNRMNAEISKARKNGDMQTAHKLEVERRNIPSVDPYDENYRRCRYVRYADDFLIGFTGSKADAEEIKAAMHNFLEEVLALALLEQANEVGCLEVLDGFSQRPDTEIEVSAPISEEMLILPLDKQEWPEECAPILKESGATTLGELVEYLNHCAASGKKPNVSEDAAAAMFPALIAFCYNNADTDGKRFFWEYILESNSLVFEGVE